MTTQVMKGIRILEVAEHTFVPAASAVLADWGADVIKVEHAERGDAMRGLGSTGVMDLSKGVHVLNEHSNRGKRSIGLDLQKPGGLEVLHALVRTSDVLLTNKLPHVLAKLKIDVADLRAINPGLVYVRGTAFGPRGPDAKRGGYDMTAYWCRAGSAASCTPPGFPAIIPQPGPAYGDSLGGMTIAGGIAGALLHRERTGEAPVVDVSLLATGAWAMASGIALSLQHGQPWGLAAMASGGGPKNPLSGVYRTKDGKFVCLVMLQAFHYWPDFCQHIGRPELVEDARFTSAEGLAENAAAAREIIAAVMAGGTLAEWTGRFSTLRGQWAPVQDTLEVAADPQVRANGYLQETQTRSGTRFQLVASPVQFDEDPTPTRRAPEFNEHGDAILQELGYDWDRILELKAAGAVA
jgi:crotonobetainyl-CoA:carnitine CoA-transferase CaiB-like acyl-CoA transferase